MRIAHDASVPVLQDGGGCETRAASPSLAAHCVPVVRIVGRRSPPHRARAADTPFFTIVLKDLRATPHFTAARGWPRAMATQFFAIDGNSLPLRGE
jgi:hypothetical protein